MSQIGHLRALVQRYRVPPVSSSQTRRFTTATAMADNQSISNAGSISLHTIERASTDDTELQSFYHRQHEDEAEQQEQSQDRTFVLIGSAILQLPIWGT